MSKEEFDKFVKGKVIEHSYEDDYIHIKFIPAQYKKDVQVAIYHKEPDIFEKVTIPRASLKLADTDMTPDIEKIDEGYRMTVGKLTVYFDDYNEKDSTFTFRKYGDTIVAMRDVPYQWEDIIKNTI